MEVVEVSPYLSGWPVERGDLPPLKSGHLPGQGGLLDASGHPKLLLYALSLAHLLLQTLLRQLCETAPLAPLLCDLAFHYAVDEHKQPSRPGCWPGNRLWSTKLGASICSRVSRSPLACACRKRRTRALFFFSADIEVLLLANSRFLQGVGNMNMMPSEEVQRIALNFTHRLPRKVHP